MSSPKRERGPIWARPAPGARKPTYSREQIAATAIAIADAEGFEAVSMRRIAAELGAGTMSIYHYVRGKDELVALLANTLMSELIVPDDELPEGWRAGMAAIARRTRAVFRRHPWIVEHMDEGDPEHTGPSLLRHVEQTLTVTARTGLSHDDQFELAAIVDDYVFGYAMRVHESRREAETRGDAFRAFVTDQLATGQYPHLQAVAGDDPAGAFERAGLLADDEERFERGLQRVLDGLELWVERARQA
jgi:AcrR family transcriptional regulator